MNYGMVLAATAVMAVVTYLPRMLPLAVFQRKIENKFIRSFLTYVPYAVLSAMTFPAILYATSDNPVTGIPSAAAGFEGVGYILAKPRLGAGDNHHGTPRE